MLNALPAPYPVKNDRLLTLAIRRDQNGNGFADHLF